MSQAKLKIDSEMEKPIPELSLFLPVLNEEENLRPMHAKIREALNELGKTAEVIYVDDGSTDSSLANLKGNCGDGQSCARDFICDEITVRRRR